MTKLTKAEKISSMFIADATAAGGTVSAMGFAVVVMRGCDGVLVHPDGTMTRYGVRLDIATRLTEAQARTALRLDRISTPGTEHLYAIGHGRDRHEGTVQVEANNRNQAASIARKAGYEVRDVNMVG
jgi:hypothetical protein